MSNLFDLEDDNDELFSTKQEKKKLSRDLDDLFGTNSKTSSKSDTLDDILAPSVEEDLFNTTVSKSTTSDDDLDDILNAQTSGSKEDVSLKTPKKKKIKKVGKKADNLFDNEVDDEPDVFGLGISSGKKSDAQSKPLDDDNLFGTGSDTRVDDDFFITTDPQQNTSPEVTSNLLLDMDLELNDKASPSSKTFDADNSFDESSEDTKDSEKKKHNLVVFDDPNEQSVTKSDDLDDLLGFNEVNVEKQSTSSSRNRADSLDMLLDDQPVGTGNDDLFSMSEPSSNKLKEQKSSSEVEDGLGVDENSLSDENILVEAPQDEKQAVEPGKSTGEAAKLYNVMISTEKSPGKTSEQTEDSFDIILDAQHSNIDPLNDDLHSLMVKNDISLTESDAKSKVRQSVQRKPSKLKRKPKNINTENSDANQEPESLHDMLDAQPKGMVSTTDDLSSMLDRNSNIEEDTPKEPNPEPTCVTLLDSVPTLTSEENDNALQDKEMPDVDVEASVDVKLEKDTKPDNSPANESIEHLVSTSDKPDSKPRDTIPSVSKLDDVTVDKTEVSESMEKSCYTSSDPSDKTNAVEKPHGKLIDQSEDSLDMLLDAQPGDMDPSNDDLHSLMMKNDTPSDVKPNVRKSVQRKPSKLNRKSKNINVKKTDTNQEPESLDDMLDAQSAGMVSTPDDLSSMVERNSNIVVDTQKESIGEPASVNLFDSDMEKASEENNNALKNKEASLDRVRTSNDNNEEKSVGKHNKTVDTVESLPPANEDVELLVSATDKPVSKPPITSKPRDITHSKSADVTVSKTEVSKPGEKSFDISSDLFEGKNAVEKTHSKKTDQSEDSLDMLLDAQPCDVDPSNDDLHSLMMKNDALSTESDSKPKVRKAVARKPSKLNRKSKNIIIKKSDANQEPESVDDMLDSQPEGMVPTTDDLLSIVEPNTNKATSSNTNATPEHASTTKETDPVDDLFGDTEDNLVDDFEFIDKDLELEESGGDNREEESAEREAENESPVDPEPAPQKKTNLKKSMERSFEDLLTGLDDESDPELEDIIPDDIDNTNLERRVVNKSLLGSPDKSYKDIRPDTSEFTSKRIDDPFDMDVVSSTPKARKTAESPQMKITPPQVIVQNPEDEDENLDISDDRDVEDADANVDYEDDIEMRSKPTRKSTMSSGDDEVDLEVIEDTNHLDVDVSKHKLALGKKGSLALRRKPSRKSRKSLLSTGDDAIFQDSTDPKPAEMMNGDDDVDTFNKDDDDEDDDRYDLSPPAKKPSPVTMMPLPGLAGRPPSQRSSSSQPDDNEDVQEVKRKSKPPPGAFVLPSMATSPQKPLRPTNETSPRESKPRTFEKPALKSVKPKERSRSPVNDAAPSYSRSGLRSTDKSDVEMKSANEERDVTFQKPSLRSTPKPNREKVPEKKMDTNAGLFEKPALRNTPKPKLEQKPDHTHEHEEAFATKNLRSVPKPDNFAKDLSSDNHMFDKPHLKAAKPKVSSDDDSVKNDLSSNFGAKTFEKPPLRSTNKNLRSESTEGQAYEPSHLFEKPPLRTGVERTVAMNKHDNFSSGTFEKPSLKKTTPSPEKEVKDIHEPKGTFDRPQLRKTDSLQDREEKTRIAEKPSWLQTASEKHERALGVLQTKENHSSSEKPLPSWLEKSPLKKTKGLPLQDTSNNQSTSSSQSDLSTEDYGKLPSTPRSRNSSQGTENEPERKASLPVSRDQNNYTPGWMRQARSPSVPSSGIISPAKSLPALNESNEIPQWKKELAQRRQNKKESKTSEELPKKDDSKEPEWKKGIMLRKTRNTAQPSKETHSVEPEWKKAAEEKRLRLRKSTVVDKTDH